MKYQCLLQTQDGKTMCAWIDDRGAKEGALVEIIDGTHTEFYRVMAVYSPPLSSKALQELKQHNRQFWDKEWRREGSS